MSRRRAFTLVELLVVIAIISVLIALLLPVLKAVRRQVDKVACASNLRQIGMGLLMYAQDNKGRFPATAHAFPDPNDWVYWHPKRDIRQSRLWPYIGKNAKVLVCPAGLGRTIAEGEYPFSYSVNVHSVYGSLPDGSSVKMTLSQVREPGHKLLLVEENSLGIRSGEWVIGSLGKEHPTYLSVRHDLESEYAGAKSMYSAIPLGSGHAISFDGSYLWIKRHWAWTPYYFDPLDVGPFRPLYP
jgi:prepilin-type N-terminal cleavage/methylation domain-containing protein